MSDTRDKVNEGPLRRLAKAIFSRLPAPLRPILSPLARLYAIFNEIRPRFWIADSQGRQDGLTITVLCAAQGRDRSYLLRQFLGDTYEERCIGRRWLWNIPKIVAGEGRGCCLAAVKTSGHFRSLVSPQRWLYVPTWVTGDVDCPLRPAVLRAETLKSDLRRIERNLLGFHVAKDISAFDDFYRHMYVPYVTDAHGDGAVIMPHESMRAMLKNSELLVVTREDKAVGGLLIAYSQAGARLCTMGIRDASREFIADGAVGALYHFSFRYLQEKGFTKVNLGFCRAFLRDGVLRYKKKLGMTLACADRGWFALKTLDESEATRALLRDTPLIFEREGQLYGAVFPQTGEHPLSEQDLQRLDKEYSMEGLARVFVVPLGDAGPAPMTPSRSSGRVVLANVSELFR